MEQVFGYIIGLGAAVMMPIIFTILGVCIKIKFGKALQSGLYVGVGFVGLSVITALLTTSLSPSLSKVVEIYDLNLEVFDMGWPAAAAVAYNTSVGAFIIPVCLLVNILMLLTKTTKTVNIDLWNYWHFAFIGAMVYYTMDNIAWGFFAAIICYILTLIAADYTAPKFQKFYDKMDGISIPQPFCQGFMPFAILINKDGKRLNPRKDDLKFMRERFAILARRNGIAMNATARAVRGQSERSKPIERVKQEQRYFEEMTKSQTSTNVESEQAIPNTAQAAAKGEPSAGQGERTTAQTGRSAGRGEHTAAQAEPSTAKAEPRAQTAEQTQAQKWAIHRKKEELKAKGSTPKASGEEKSPRPHPYQQARDEEIITALKEGKPLDEPEALSKAKRTRKQVQANAAKAVSELASSGDAAEQALAAGLVVICFQISIFEPLETALTSLPSQGGAL